TAYRFQSTLSEDDVLKRSISVLKTFELKTPEQPISMSTQFGKDLGMDSLDYNDALVALEEEFDVVFDDKVANEITTVGEAVKYISKNHMPEEDILDKEV
ncbi:acyl carrier protein, partial [Pichia californica]